MGSVLFVLVVMQSAWAQNQNGQQVTAVKFQGLERVSAQVVESQLEVQVGQPLNVRAISRDIRRLYELGYFTNVKADSTVEGAGVAITYILEEKRVISEVKIIGNEKIKDRNIRGVITFREGESFVADAFGEERKSILDLYAAKGFANSQVDIIAEKVGPSRVRVIYDINEGKKARINSIALSGNDSLSKKKIKKLMVTKRKKWFLGGKYEEAKFEHDLRTILDEYGNYGRLEADISKTDILYTPNGRGMDITLHVQEGPEYTVNQLDVANNVVYDDGEAKEWIDVFEEDVHNKGQVEKDASNIESAYQESGYINATVTPQVTLDREAKTTHVTHNVREGDLKYIRQLDIAGNEVTKDEVIRRELLITPGDRYDGKLVDFSKRRLEGTRYFEGVRLFPLDVEGDDLFSDLRVDVEEGSVGTFNFGAGFSTEDGVSGFTELNVNNFDITNWPKFTGGGQQLKLRLNLGSQRDEYSLSFTDPEILGYPLAFGFDAYNESYRVNGGADYTEDKRGLQIRFGKVLSPYNTVRVNFGYALTDISELPFFINESVRRQRGETSTISTRWQFERSTVDRKVDTSEGANHLISLQLAAFGDNEFYRLDHDSSWYFPFGEERNWVLSLRTREGYVAEWLGSDYVSLQDRMYAGGTTTVRGYDNRDIGPKEKEFIFFGKDFSVGGNLRWVTNTEMKYKVTDLLRVYGFFDTGGVWADASDFDFGDIKYSVGVGIGFDVPRMGPIRIDYGWPLNPDGDQGGGKLHMQTGLRF